MTEPAPWTRLFNRIKSQIPAAVDAVIRQEIFATMVDFTQDTNIWIEEVPIAIEPNVTSYPFTVTGGTPNRLMFVQDTQRPGCWAEGNLTMRVPGVLRLWRVPNTTASWTAFIAKACSTPQMDGSPPKDTGYPEVDAWIVEKNNDAIFYGTLYFLYRQPAKPYNNVQSAAANNALYQTQKAQARVNNLRANVFGGQAWTFPQGFATTTRKGWT